MRHLKNFEKVNYVESLISNGAKVANYRKSALITGVFAKGGEVVVTILKNGLEETKNIAKAGDFIAINKGGEKYIIPAETFSKTYIKVEGGYQKAAVTSFVEIPEDVVIDAPWGGEQTILAGGSLIYAHDANSIYGIGKDELAETYVEVK